MTDQVISHVVERTAAIGTVSGGAWMSYEAITEGLNLATAGLGVLAGVMAVIWWFYKSRASKLDVEIKRLELEKIRRDHSN